MAKKLSAADMHRLARIGAAARLGQLEREIASLRRAFPGLKPAAGPPEGAPSPDGTPRAEFPANASRRGRRKPMSAAERKAVSERMRRYWDDKRKTKAR